ncbi:tetratricopeptide repeat protein [Rubrobacter marinus]|uniref:Tetratricopeptide repeat protein n=1 Tax=Rubrobacter marinus TaxID=2653852 RepID=A0A6G8PVN7_9ACTN|nr:tetratricopeptide repeat protein [Rubrobacter marinus]QIN78270.1 tetratricopeptide repeat protein [Rubrobacter marinus]
MMMNRDKLGLWTRIGAILLAVLFVLSFVLFGIGSNVSYNPLDLFRSPEDQQAAQQTTGSEEQIERARAELEENPEDPRVIRRLAGLYLQNGQTSEAVRVLEEGREAAPNDPAIPLVLGQAYDQQAQALTDAGEREATYAKAGEAYVAAAEIEENERRDAQAFLLAGAAYEQAGDKGRAIQYWNEYLEIEPEGEQADAVKERIGTLLQGGETTGAAAEGAEGQ